MNHDEQRKLAEMKTAMDDAVAATAGALSRSRGEQLIWLAGQGLPLGASFLPPGMVTVPTPRALGITVTMLGTCVGALASSLTTKGALAVALSVLRTNGPGVEFPLGDAPMLEACVEHLRCCYARLRTMADDHAIAVLVEVVAQLTLEMMPGLHGS